MNYQEIKDTLAAARKLAQAGDIAGADTLIRTLRGATPRDVSEAMGPVLLGKLRRHAKGAKGAK